MSRKSHIRCALTNGYEWLFPMLSINLNGKGASYRISDRSYSAAPQETGINVDVVIPDMASYMIAGILASWVCCQVAFECLLYSFFLQIKHSSEDLLEHDWFD